MEVLEKGWMTLALGFAALFLGLNLGKDLAYYGMAKFGVAGATTTTTTASAA